MPTAVPEATPALLPLCAAAFVAYASYSICRAPLLPLFARELGAGPALVGLVVGASTLTGVVVKMPAGALSDVLGRRPLLLAGALVFALLPFTYLGAASIGLLLLLRAIHGHATAIFGPVASATVSDLAPPAQRGQWLATYATAQGLGQAFGPILAGYLIAARRFDLAFLASGTIGLAAPFLVARGVPATPVRAGGDRWRAFTAGLREVVRHRLVLVTSAAHAGQFVMNGALNAFLPLYGRDVIGLTTPQLGWLFATQTAVTLAVRPLLGAASDRLGRRAVIVAGLALCGGSVGAVALSASTWTLVPAVVVYAPGVATTSAATSAFITDVTPRARFGAAHGVFGTIYDIGDAAGPIAAGVLVGAFGYAVMFAAVASIGLAMAAMFAVAARPAPTASAR